VAFRRRAKPKLQWARGKFTNITLGPVQTSISDMLSGWRVSRGDQGAARVRVERILINHQIANLQPQGTYWLGYDIGIAIGNIDDIAVTTITPAQDPNADWMYYYGGWANTENVVGAAAPTLLVRDDIRSGRTIRRFEETLFLFVQNTDAFANYRTNVWWSVLLAIT